MSISSVIYSSGLEVSVGAGIGFILELFFNEAEKVVGNNSVAMLAETLAQYMASGLLASMWFDNARRRGISSESTKNLPFIMSLLYSQPNLRAKTDMLLRKYAGGFRMAFTGQTVPQLQKPNAPGFIPTNTHPANSNTPDGYNSNSLFD
jgi:hypothetical protein